MRLLYCDESNLEEREGDFLLYAGISIPTERAESLHQAIGQLREARGIERTERVKFAPAAAPLTHAEYRELKQAIIEAAVEHDCKLHAYAVLHDLARNPDQARRFGINTICWHFQCALNRANEAGLVLIDRFNDEGNQIDAHLREKMTAGVEIPHRGVVQLDRIVGFHYSAIEQSHFTSLIDIVVGSLRWAINVHTRNLEMRDAALNLLGVLSPLFWRGGHDGVPDIGFCFSPFNIRREAYFGRYIALQQFLRDGGIPSIQPINHTG